VREKKGLTYDANFQLSAYERLCGGWWLVTVTASPANSQKALDACIETLKQVSWIKFK
jgi:microcompartment protein CcmL/EutN